MKSFFYKIINSEFLTFTEVLRLKVSIVNVFLIVFVVLSIPVSSISDFKWGTDLVIPIMFTSLLIITFILTMVNFNRFAMHSSILTISLVTWFYVSGTNYFFSYILFFVALTVIIFYQDIMTYLLYGGALTIAGVLYVHFWGDSLVGTNTIGGASGESLSSLTYQVILVGFYIVFFIQFLLSDNIYEKLNNEWVRMNKTLEKYQEFTHSYLNEIVQASGKEAVYKDLKFQQAVNEISCFINEFFEDEGSKIAEVVEFYFFIHNHEVNKVVEDVTLPVITRKYANELKKYLLNYRSEMVSVLFDFSTLFKGDEKYDESRYEYDLSKLFENRIDKLLSLALLYKFLKTEITQFDKWGQISRKLTHEEITELFISTEFREFISFEQVNFYLDNQEIFDKHL